MIGPPVDGLKSIRGAGAGPLVHDALTALVQHPRWNEIPEAQRRWTMKATISAMRHRAATALQIEQPELVRQGMQRRLEYINGR
jgi:hypothetical protein